MYGLGAYEPTCTPLATPLCTTHTEGLPGASRLTFVDMVLTLTPLEVSTCTKVTTYMTLMPAVRWILSKDSAMSA